MKLTGIERPFGGEIRKFDLSPIGAWRAVEARCGVGLGKVFGRLWSSMSASDTGRANPLGFEFFGDDIREVLFQGLKGGGMPDSEASKLVRANFDDVAGKGQFAPLAVEIVSAWWFGLPEPDEGKTKAPETESETPIAPGVSTSAPSTEPVPS